MTRREAIRQTRQLDTLRSLGFPYNEAEALRRISMTLRRWHELECGTDLGCIERDEKTKKTYWLNSYTGKRQPTPDRETGARKRLAQIIDARNLRESGHGTNLRAYVQGDTRGAALYILRPDDAPIGQEDSCYSRGICVY